MSRNDFSPIPSNSVLFLNLLYSISNICYFKVARLITNQYFLSLDNFSSLCFNLVNGGWSTWSIWSDCKSNPCGAGHHRRYRVCDNPTPRWGGKTCVGPSDQKNKCSISCPGNQIKIDNYYTNQLYF